MLCRLIVNIGGTKVRRETLEGRPHLVCNGVVLTEAVIEGSEGAFLYPAEENGKNPAAWNGMPLVAYHPKKGGNFVSARDPAVFDTRKVGTVFNTVHEDKKLKPEFWFDEERVKEVDVRIYEAIVNEKPMEVSTGLDMDVEMTPGEFNGKKYAGVSRNHRPDHIAILPDKIGACSIAMGGGLFANAAREPQSTQEALSRTLAFVLNTVGASITTNEMSFSDITCGLSDLLAGEYGDKGKYWRGYVCDVYPTYVIFRDQDDNWFSVEYTASDKDGVKLSGKAVPVTRVVEYKPVTANEKETQTMAFDKKAHIAGLIANGTFEEKDRSVLEAMPETILEKIKLTANSGPAVPPVVPPPPAPAIPVPPVTANEWLRTLPEGVRQSVQRSLDRDKLHKDGLIAGIVANSKFDKAFLEQKDIPELEALAELAQPNHADGTHNGMFRPEFATNGGTPAYYGAAGYYANVAATDLEPPLTDAELFPAAKSK